jgi:hypothetical protein
MSRRRRSAAIVAGIVLTLATASGLYRVAAAPPEPMKTEDFARYTRHVASLARETALLADQLRRNRVTGHFARAHRQKLQQEAEDQAEKLDTPVPPQLAEAGERARSLTTALADNLRNLGPHLTETAFLERTAADAARLAEEMAKLEPAK